MFVVIMDVSFGNRRGVAAQIHGRRGKDEMERSTAANGQADGMCVSQNPVGWTFDEELRQLYLWLRLRLERFNACGQCRRRPLRVHYPLSLTFDEGFERDKAISDFVEGDGRRIRRCLGRLRGWRWQNRRRNLEPFPAITRWTFRIPRRLRIFRSIRTRQNIKML